MLLDNSILVLDAIHRRLSGKRKGDARHSLIRGTRELPGGEVFLQKPIAVKNPARGRQQSLILAKAAMFDTCAGQRRNPVSPPVG